MCTNPEEINHGMKEDLKRKETELLTRLDSITSELSRSIILFFLEILLKQLQNIVIYIQI